MTAVLPATLPALAGFFLFVLLLGHLEASFGAHACADDTFRRRLQNDFVAFGECFLGGFQQLAAVGGLAVRLACLVGSDVNSHGAGCTSLVTVTLASATTQHTINTGRFDAYFSCQTCCQIHGVS
jgi:hypothetical protein